MNFIHQINALASRAASQLDHFGTVEATKNVLVMPFINVLGENFFDVQPNGLEYRQLSEFETASMMNSRPSLEFGIRIISGFVVNELKKLANLVLDLNQVLSTAREQKDPLAMKRFFIRQWSEPMGNSMRFAIGDVMGGRSQALCLTISG